MLKKVFLTCLMLAVVPAAVFALTIDGTQTQGKGTVAVGLGSEYIIKKDLNLKLNPSTGYYSEAKLLNLYRAYLRPSLGIMDGVDIYTRFGITDFSEREKVNGIKQKTEAQQAFLTGVGLKVSYEITDGIIWGTDLSFSYSKSRVKYNGTLERWNMNEWHIAPYIGKIIGNAVPYIGIKYDDMRIKAKTESGAIYKYMGKTHFGIFSGMDYGIGEKVCLNLEGRFINEYGVSVGVNVRF
jgi:hypothetical protein